MDVLAEGEILRSRSPHTLGGMQKWTEICIAGGLDLGPLIPESDAPGLAVFPLVLRESALTLARPRLTGPRAAIDEAYLDDVDRAPGKDKLVRIVSMLTKLIERLLSAS